MSQKLLIRGNEPAFRSGVAHGDRFFKLLAFILLGYAIIGKGFAYLGIPPLYIGEIVMLYGLFALAVSPNSSRLLRTSWFWPLFAFMFWGACRTIPYIDRYGTDALRDAAVWIWGTYAIVIASLLAAKPSRIRDVERMFRTFIPIFLLAVPVVSIVMNLLGDSMIQAPWADVPLLLIKGGDIDVHLTGILAYAVLVGGFNSWFITLTTVFEACLTFTGRAAMLTFGMGVAILTCLKPKSPILLRLFPTILIGFALLWISNIHIATGQGNLGREISADQMIQNVTSVFSDSDNRNLSGSKEWRLDWWNTIIGYTFHGKYFWTGKGFGVNLADEDGFQVEKDHSLRSPHNGHITMLARAGVPGLSLWILLQCVWALILVHCALSAHRRDEKKWCAIFIFLLIYWSAFMANAAFDVYLESPPGGIWMWCVYGVGLGSAWIFRHDPRALDDPENAPSLPPIHRERPRILSVIATQAGDADVLGNSSGARLSGALFEEAPDRHHHGQQRAPKRPRRYE